MNPRFTPQHSPGPKQAFQAWLTKDMNHIQTEPLPAAQKSRPYLPTGGTQSHSQDAVHNLTQALPSNCASQERPTEAPSPVPAVQEVLIQSDMLLPSKIEERKKDCCKPCGLGMSFRLCCRVDWAQCGRRSHRAPAPFFGEFGPFPPQCGAGPLAAPPTDSVAGQVRRRRAHPRHPRHHPLVP